MGVSLLVVEDEMLLAMDLRMCVEGMGYDVAAIAFSGHDAILQASTLKPDLVLSRLLISVMMLWIFLRSSWLVSGAR